VAALAPSRTTVSYKEEEMLDTYALPAILVVAFMLWRMSRAIPKRSIAALVVALIAAITYGVYIWPGLPVSADDASLTRQSTVAAALFQAFATLLVLLLTAVLLALQLVARFSIRLAQTVLSRGAITYTLLFIVTGVGVPLWAALDPSPRASRLAFVCAAAALLSLFVFLPTLAERLQPDLLLYHAAAPGLAALRRVLRRTGRRKLRQGLRAAIVARRGRGSPEDSDSGAARQDNSEVKRDSWEEIEYGEDWVYDEGDARCRPRGAVGHRARRQSY